MVRIKAHQLQEDLSIKNLMITTYSVLNMIDRCINSVALQYSFASGVMALMHKFDLMHRTPHDWVRLV